MIVPTFNRDRYLHGAINSLIAQETNSKFHFEIIVIDNGSSDDTHGVIKMIAEKSAVPVKYFLEERAGVAQARNEGVRVSGGGWLAFFDDDQIANVDWLKNLFEGARSTGSKCVGGAVHLDLSEDELNQFTSSYRESIFREFSNPTGDSEARPYRHDEYPGTGNALFARSIFDDVGLFDESMIFGGEDHDLGIRIRRAGYGMWYIPNAIIKHRLFPKRLTSEYMRWDSAQGGTETAYIDRKHRGLGSVFSHSLARMAKSLTVTLPRLLYARVTRNPAAELDCELQLRRQEGYVRAFLALSFPRLFSEESLKERWAFRKGREIELS